MLSIDDWAVAIDYGSLQVMRKIRPYEVPHSGLERVFSVGSARRQSAARRGRPTDSRSPPSSPPDEAKYCFRERSERHTIKYTLSIYRLLKSLPDQHL